MRQKLRKFQQKLGGFYLPILMMGFIFIALAISWNSIKPTVYTVELNQVAKETIRATKTIENTAQTEMNRKTARDSVSDIYHYDTEIANKQVDTVGNLFAAIRVVASKSSQEIASVISVPQDNNAANSRTYVASKEDRIKYFKQSLETTNATIKDVAIFVPDWVIGSLMESTDSELTAFETALKETVLQAMSESIKESQLPGIKEEAKKQLFYNNFTDNERNLLEQLLDIVIVSNNVLDTVATENAREAAANGVSPVRILQGQVIIQEGEVIDQADLQKLELLGLINGFPNYNIAIGFFISIMLLVVFLLLDLFSQYYLNQTTMEEREYAQTQLTAFIFLFLVGLILLVSLQLIQARGSEYIALIFPVAAFSYLVAKITRKYDYSIAFTVAFSLITWFVFQNDSNLLQTISLSVYYLLTGLIGSIVAHLHVKTNTPLIKVVAIICHVLFIFPIVYYSNLDWFSSSTLMMMMFVGISSIEFILLPFIAQPYLEYLFEDNSVLLLAELSNPNQDLLKQLITIAPGTYHHSLMVANISANCVEAIGGDSLLARVACYYHDIGKIEHPFFFIENVPSNMENPHSLLSPYESKEIIFDHVRKGVKILEQHGFPKAIVDICAQHHGTTLMKYFYAEALKLDPNCEEDEFRYPGPKPQTKEAAIISIVDSAEAATRAMKQPTLEKVKTLVHSIIMSRVEDGQLIECDLTVQELAIVEKNIIASLNGTFHSRIEYPSIKKERK